MGMVGTRYERYYNRTPRIYFDEDDVSEAIDKYSKSLIGKALTTKEIKRSSLETALRNIWG
ncbi:uncharacterized protein G2W53_018276 [Senna tora]|uniref:Uncharacterized protein n=1 Tax=Senna tora TaxID=362788 RepID=A0A834TTC1_9FABA|nr:uncharacterized protein G2W53_018276 [Senna tora]